MSLDTGISKSMDNLRKMLIIELTEMLEKDIRPSRDEWDKFDRKFNKYFDYKETRIA
jgi:hypothetical protein